MPESEAKMPECSVASDQKSLLTLPLSGPGPCWGKIDKAVGSAVRETVIAPLDLQGSRGPVFLWFCFVVCLF